MIKINNIPSARKLESLCQEHCKIIQANVVERCRYIQHVLGTSVVHKQDSTIHFKTKDSLKLCIVKCDNDKAENIVNYLIEANNIEEILTCKPKCFDSVWERFKRETGYTRSEASTSSEAELVKAIFSYNYFAKSGFETSEKKRYSAATLIENLNIKVCPYCNRNYITLLKDKLRPDLDHFYSQAIYPIFALSFYNLIPSCSVCNSRFKGKTIMNTNSHIHPYNEGFGEDAKFECYATPSLQIRDIKLHNHCKDEQKKQRIANSDSVFHIEEIYKTHGDIAQEIYEKAIEESEEHFLSITNAIQQIKVKKQDFYRFYFNNYYEEKNFEKRPLSKFTKDLVDHLGILGKIDFS